MGLTYQKPVKRNFSYPFAAHPTRPILIYFLKLNALNTANATETKANVT